VSVGTLNSTHTLTVVLTYLNVNIIGHTNKVILKHIQSDVTDLN